MTYSGSYQVQYLQRIVINAPLGYILDVNPERNYEFWDRFPGLVWSNRHASDTVMIRATLMRGRFDVFQVVAEHFGIERLYQEWEILCLDPLMKISPAHRKVCERFFAQVEAGRLHAA